MITRSGLCCRIAPMAAAWLSVPGVVSTLMNSMPYSSAAIFAPAAASPP
jgi:hypothetical protein